ncbi:MAG: hypothetical protein K0Q97_2536 [Bacillota bacterium]|nr:hypothetical protein [Bacillota bacterium]
MKQFEINNLYNRIKTYGIYNKYKYNKAESSLDIFISEVPVNNEVGFIELSVTKNLGKEIGIGAVLKIYVNTELKNQELVETITITHNPTKIELPVAHPLGDLIKGPEYYFTTYNITIENEGYYKITTLNIRLFPKITSKFQYNLNEITTDTLEQEIIIDIPPHPRDIINGQKN